MGIGNYPPKKFGGEEKIIKKKLQPPSIEQLEEWMQEGGCEAIDECWVEPDGTCEHGCRSWLLIMGLI